MKRIVWAVTKEQFTHARIALLPGVIGVVNSSLDAFDASAEWANEVLVLEGHPNTAACVSHYAKRGAKVTPFALPAPVEPAPAVEPVAPKKTK